MYQNPLTNKIIELLIPLIGKVMAESVIKVQTKKMNADPEKLSTKDLSAIAERFEAHLKIFVGTEKASQIGATIRRRAV